MERAAEVLATAADKREAVLDLKALHAKIVGARMQRDVPRLRGEQRIKSSTSGNVINGTGKKKRSSLWPLNLILQS